MGRLELCRGSFDWGWQVGVGRVGRPGGRGLRMQIDGVRTREGAMVMEGCIWDVSLQGFGRVCTS